MVWELGFCDDFLSGEGVNFLGSLLEMVFRALVEAAGFMVASPAASRPNSDFVLLLAKEKPSSPSVRIFLLCDGLLGLREVMR